ncbi:OLC1v1035294C1 [Oldenlandia corymbosa var. corymbosa]|uniref:OLC1v1035294C1 n=1 Tax=Oldenlandia corymbosa var. corymbosa TaxID=529605 RepID=A0AAV1CTC6_OLDCO|nr:OLC1v1035294C1 [Oldenlandia corymbosa var. corymbosa]
MASGNTAPQNFRKALGALKDSTTVGMAIVNSENKDMDVAIVKATKHDEVIPKEKHVRKILLSLSSASPRADVAYCIHALARRLYKTHTWTVALKTLIVIHRGLREVDATFQQELISYNDSRGHLLSLSHFKDDSTPRAWECSSWVRCYALYLEESLECFRSLKFNIQKDYSKSKVVASPDLLEQLPRLQQLLFRLLDCQPSGGAQYNFLIQYALSIVAAESVKLYVTITDGIVNLVDKFFEMQRHDAIRALEIYKKAGKQAEQLSEFFEFCRNFEFGRGQKYARIEQAPASFLIAMEEYVNDAPQTIMMIAWKGNDNDKMGNPEEITAEETSLGVNQEPDDETQKCSSESDPSMATNDKGDTKDTALIADLLNLDDLSPEPIIADTNPLALAITTQPADQSSTPPVTDLMTQSNWELALVSTPSSGLTPITSSTMGGGINRLTLDTLYDAALAQKNPNGIYEVTGVSASNPFEDSAYSSNPFFLPTNAGQHIDAQVLSITQNEEPLMPQPQQYLVPGHEPSNPFGNPFIVDQGTSYPSHNQSQQAG